MSIGAAGVLPCTGASPLAALSAAFDGGGAFAGGGGGGFTGTRAGGGGGGGGLEAVRAGDEGLEDGADETLAWGAEGAAEGGGAEGCCTLGRMPTDSAEGSRPAIGSGGAEGGA
jgi:hypothetical protein